MRVLKYAFMALVSVALGAVGLGAAQWKESDFSGIKFNQNKGADMTILIIGANGSVAKEAINGFLAGSNANLKLFLRKAKRLDSVAKANPVRVELIEGNATDKAALKAAMKNVNVVYANLAGDLPSMAEAIISAMKEVGVKRLVWISSYGIYQDIYAEIPDRNAGAIHSMLKPYAASAKIVEDSGLDYTIIRPQWFSSADEINYELTRKGEPFKNPSGYISRKSIAHLILRLCLESNFGIGESYGINKPAR